MIAIFMIGFIMGGIVGATMAALINIIGEDGKENENREEENDNNRDYCADFRNRNNSNH